MKLKLLVIVLVLAFIGLTACNDRITSRWVNVIIDNKTSQDFIIVIDDYQKGILIGGGVDTVVLINDQRKEYQLRWVNPPWPMGDGLVNVIYIPIDNTMRKIYIQGQDGEYHIEFVGAKHN